MNNKLDNKVFLEDIKKLIEHYRYPKEKQKLQNFLQETWRKYETEKVEQTVSRIIHEHGSELQGSKPHYRPGHIGPLVYEHMNMVAVENAFVSGLQHTKSSMVKTIQQRVDEINTILRGVGGFNRQVKSAFSRSAIVYLEQQDFNNKHREKVVFSINLSDFELRYPLNEEAVHCVTEDGRSGRRYGWDFAVNALSEIVSNTGLKPKYVKNDKINCKFVMGESLLTHNEPVPDEFFKFCLEYITQEKINQRMEDYNSRIDSIQSEIDKRKKKLTSTWLSKKRKAWFTEDIDRYEKDLSFYIGTNPDPNELDPGLLFTIEVMTLKDHSITKDKMQIIMTKYIVALSKIAQDKSMDQQLATDYSSRDEEVFVEKKDDEKACKMIYPKEENVNALN